MTENASNGLVSVVMPAYKQENTICEDIIRVKKILESLKLNYEIVVVADGTLDATYDRAKTLEEPCVRVFGYPGRNRGKGYALRFGAAKAGGDRVVFLDAGMDIDPSGIAMLLAHMDWYQADAVIGSKRHPVSRVEYPLVRRITSIGYQLLVKLLFGLNVKDTQTGLKIFRRQLLEKVMPRLLVKDYAIDIEILAVAHHLGYKRIYEAPVSVTHNFASLTQRSIIRVIFKMLRDTLAVFYRLKIRHYYDDGNERKWVFDPELQMAVNVG